MSTFTSILEHKIVAIIRGADPIDVWNIAQSLREGGIRVMEITLNSRGALQVIELLAQKMSNDMLIGAGTVLDAASAKAAMAAGARFIISPNFDPATVEITRQMGAVSIPGAFTPTEILTAHQGGGEIIKLFPANLGPSYVSNIRGPLPNIPLMPTGGVGPDNIVAFQRAGAAAFGIGSSLVNPSERVSDKWLDELTHKARQLVNAIGHD
jgi:2-dehydro-3-deoxyphosphogluconate aldolase / (4S)-4-hydroxy-2-oxoglutarate aldolase